MNTEQLKEKNDKFNALSPAEKRRAIARDVLEQLDAKIYTPSHVYVSMWGMSRSLKNDELQPVLYEPGVTCTVCGIGSLFLSSVRMGDDFTVTSIGTDYSYLSTNSIGWDRFFGRLTDFFSETQVDLVETVYECMPTRSLKYSDFGARASDYGETLGRPDEYRLRHIMEKIAEDPQGLFVIPGYDEHGHPVPAN